VRPDDLIGLDPQRVAILADYDGSLAPIVEHPEDARPLPGARPALAELVEVAGLVGVVSGRPAAFLQDRIGVPGLMIVGQYGLERVEGGSIVLDPRVDQYADAVAAARREAELRWPELFIEEKGSIAFSVHWRSRPDRAVGDEVATLAARYGLRAHGGRLASEVRPPIGVDKGVAVAELVDGFEGALFAGDDEGDLPAFAALERVAVPVRIGVQSAEAPAGLVDAVDVMVDGPDGVVALLRGLAEKFNQPR